MLFVKQEARTGNITYNASSVQYCFFAIPSSFGTPTFTVGGFSGGFSLVDTITFVNSSNYSNTYNIYKSTQPNLGSFTATIS